MTSAQKSIIRYCFHDYTAVELAGITGAALESVHEYIKELQQTLDSQRAEKELARIKRKEEHAKQKSGGNAGRIKRARKKSSKQIISKVISQRTEQVYIPVKKKEKVLETRHVDYSKMVLVKVDSKTSIYIKREPNMAAAIKRATEMYKSRRNG